MELHRAGHQVIVLEARDRVGGRTWSAMLLNGVVVERGGEWIGADQHVIRRLCAELELPLAPHGVRLHRRRVDGDVPTLAGLERTIAAVLEQFRDEDATLEAAFMAGLGAGYGADPTFLRIATSTAGEPRTASAHFNVSRAAAAAGLDAAAGWSAATSGSRRHSLRRSATGSGDRVDRA